MRWRETPPGGGRRLVRQRPLRQCPGERRTAILGRDGQRQRHEIVVERLLVAGEPGIHRRSQLGTQRRVHGPLSATKPDKLLAQLGRCRHCRPHTRRPSGSKPDLRQHRAIEVDDQLAIGGQRRRADQPASAQTGETGAVVELPSWSCRMPGHRAAERDELRGVHLPA